MKTIKSFLIAIPLLLCFLLSYAQTKFEHNDIIGYWEYKDQYIIRIEEHTATLSTIINKKFPQKLRNNIFYSAINHNGDNTWSADRFQWKYVGDDVNDGRWVNEGKVTFIMSEDKSTITQGNRVFKKINQH